MPTIDELEGWMTTGQAARRIGRSREGTLTLARDRRLRAVYVGGRYGRGVWIYDPAGVEAFRRERGEGDAR